MADSININDIDADTLSRFADRLMEAWHGDAMWLPEDPDMKRLRQAAEHIQTAAQLLSGETETRQQQELRGALMTIDLMEDDLVIAQMMVSGIQDAHRRGLISIEHEEPTHYMTPAPSERQVRHLEFLLGAPPATDSQEPAVEGQPF